MEATTVFALSMMMAIPIVIIIAWRADKPNPNTKNKRLLAKLKDYPSLPKYLWKNRLILIVGMASMFLFSKCLTSCLGSSSPKGEFNEVTGKPYDQYRFLK